MAIAAQPFDSAQDQQPVPPPWAYTVNPPPAPGAKPAPAPPDPAPRQVPGSTVSLTVAQTRDAFNPPDWHPSGHPAMPDSVARGRRPEMRACGFCHLVNGQGRPENASLAGLPAAYIIQQMADFKNGDRKSAEPRMGPPNAMIQDAKAAHDDEIKVGGGVLQLVPVHEMDSRRRSDDGAEDPRRRLDARADQRRHRAARPAHHRDARGPGAHRATRCLVWIRRLRPARQHCER